VKDLKSLFSDLKLFGMKESIDYRLMESAKAGLGYDDFLNLLIEDEQLHRVNLKAEKLRKRATFKDTVLLSDFDTNLKRGISKIMIKEFQTLNFLRGFENIIFVGETGVGKSFLAQAIGHAACISGKESKFAPMNYLFEQYKAAERAGQVLTFLKRFSSYQVLIIDDLGLRKFTHEEATVLYQIIEDRYQKGSTIITTQIQIPGFRDLFDDQVLAEAIIDRLISNAHIIEIKNDNYRKKQSPKKKIAIENETNLS
jgi:DNA replication protein DnaC